MQLKPYFFFLETLTGVNLILFCGISSSYSKEKKKFYFICSKDDFPLEVHSQIHFKRDETFFWIWFPFNFSNWILSPCAKYTTMRNSLSVGRVFVLRENQLMKQIYWISRHFPQYRGSLHIANFDFWKKI